MNLNYDNATDKMTSQGDENQLGNTSKDLIDEKKEIENHSFDDNFKNEYEE